MTPEQVSLLIAALGGAGSLAALRSIVVTAMQLWAKYRGNGRELEERHAARVDSLSQDDKARLWSFVEQMKTDARLSDERHDQELQALSERHDLEIRDLREKVADLQVRLADAKTVAALNEAERQQAMRLYSELLIAHQHLKQDHEALQIQLAALTAENTEMRRRLPAPGGTT